MTRGNLPPASSPTGSSRRYEFGDTLNLDVNATLLSTIQRNGLTVPLDLDYQDLQVHQCEYQSSCATVLMLDCSHSMILYGEDRFTPAKKVALALTHLIRTQYPGDSLHWCCSTIQRRSCPSAARARAGGSVLHQYPRRPAPGPAAALPPEEGYAPDRHDHRRQALALTLEDGRIYRNAFGLDPLVVVRTLHEVARCRRNGILDQYFHAGAATTA